MPCIALTEAWPGITFSPDGRYAYVTDTGAGKAFRGYDNAGRSTM
jgi:gluconolactonase